MALTISNQYLISLFRSVVRGVQPPEKPDEVSWTTLHQNAKRQSMLGLAFHAIAQLEHKPAEPLYSKWRADAKVRMAKAIQQEAAFHELLASFEKDGLRCLPLKGYFLQRLYPDAHLREMSDIDILVDDDRSEAMRARMGKMGYTAGEKTTYHVEYQKPPMVTVELHRQLVGSNHAFAPFFSSVWDRAIRETESPVLYSMALEDFYVHMIVHAMLHYQVAGCGVRHVLDVYLFLNRYRDSMNWETIRRGIAECGAESFETMICGLAESWFGEGVYDRSQERLEQTIFQGGVYGNAETAAKNQINRYVKEGSGKRMAKIRYIWSMIFLPYQTMKCEFPVLRKWPVFLPFFWIYRIFRTIFSRKRKIQEMVRIVKDAEVDADSGAN